MFNDKRIAFLESQVKRLQISNEELSLQIIALRDTCTMRVGERLFFFGGNNNADKRPIATAIDLINQILEHQKLIVKAVPASSAAFTLTKS